MLGGGEIFVRTPVFEPQGFCRNPKSDTKDPDSEDERSGKGKKSGSMRGQQYNLANQDDNGKRKADDFVANTGARNYN